MYKMINYKDIETVADENDVIPSELEDMLSMAEFQWKDNGWIFIPDMEQTLHSVMNSIMNNTMKYDPYITITDYSHIIDNFRSDDYNLIHALESLLDKDFILKEDKLMMLWVVYIDLWERYTGRSFTQEFMKLAPEYGIRNPKETLLNFLRMIGLNDSSVFTQYMLNSLK